MTVTYLAELVEPIVASIEASPFLKNNGWTVDMTR